MWAAKWNTLRVAQKYLRSTDTMYSLPMILIAYFCTDPALTPLKCGTWQELGGGLAWDIHYTSGLKSHGVACVCKKIPIVVRSCNCEETHLTTKFNSQQIFQYTYICLTSALHAGSHNFSLFGNRLWNVECIMHIAARLSLNCDCYQARSQTHWNGGAHNNMWASGHVIYIYRYTCTS